MKLYDDVIRRTLEMVSAAGEVRELAVEDSQWPEVSDRSMILRSEMAYELGADRNDGLGVTLISGSEELIREDRITLVGKDLSELKKAGPYARIALVRVDEAVMGEGETLYNAIRKLEYTRYHFYPEGFMNRISSSKHKESVRIGKEALSKGLDFAKTGSMMIQKFKENPRVRAVWIIYVTEEAFDYKQLLTLSCDAEDITKTIDHIFKNVQMDCKACNLQEICDEVEGLRELHFGKK